MSYGANARLAVLLVLAGGSLAAAQVPFIDAPLVPATVAPGSPAFTLIVNGGGFQAGSVVLWNGNPVSTTYLSSTRLSASIPTALVNKPQTAMVTVSSGARLTSNSAQLLVETTRPVIAFTPDPGFAAKGVVQFATGDFNGDRRLDLVVYVYPSTVELLPGNGNGTFKSPVPIASIADDPNRIIPADLNGDGKLDLILLYNFGHSATYLGNGDGTFQAAQPMAIPQQDFPDFAAIGDFNGDGNIDLVYSHNAAGAASILFGRGDGTFAAGGSLAAGTTAEQIGVADLNGDGFADLAIAGNDGSIHIFLNDGIGDMNPAGTVPGIDSIEQFVLGDFNGDGFVDIAAIDASNGTALVFRGHGDGTFGAATGYAVGVAQQGVTAGDFDGDGNLDLAIPTMLATDSSISFLMGNGDGTFRPPLVYGALAYSNLTAVDWNGDGQLDFAGIAGSPYHAAFILSPLLQTSVLATPGLQTLPTTAVTLTGPPETVTVTNIAAAPLHVTSLQVSGANPADFAISADLCSGQTVASKASCSFSVEFTPTAPAFRAASVNVLDNARVSPQTVPLQGLASELSVTPSALNFGTVAVGHVSSAQLAAISNPGTVSDQLTVEVGGADAQDFLMENTCSQLEGTLPAGETCSMLVRFIPTAKGVRTGTVSIADTVGQVTLTVSLTGTGS